MQHIPSQLHHIPKLFSSLKRISHSCSQSHHGVRKFTEKCNCMLQFLFCPLQEHPKCVPGTDRFENKMAPALRYLTVIQSITTSPENGILIKQQLNKMTSFNIQVSCFVVIDWPKKFDLVQMASNPGKHQWTTIKINMFS